MRRFELLRDLGPVVLVDAKALFLVLFLKSHLSVRSVLCSVLALFIVLLGQESVTRAAAPGHPLSYGYTYHAPDGNRLVSGQGGLPNATVIDVTLSAAPLWLVAAPLADVTIWAAVLADGTVEGFRLSGTRIESLRISPHSLAPGMPPCLMIRNNQAHLLTPPQPDASRWTHPVAAPSSNYDLVYIESSGALIFWNEQQHRRLSVQALPDARVVFSRDGLLALLSHPTRRYAHGVLGDTIEAASLTLIDLRRSQKLQIIPIAGETVIEGIAPILADVDGDGVFEIVVTESNKAQGARLVVYRANGDIVAHGPPIGQGHRWRHQLAVGPFGPRGEIELVSVQTPHIGGIVEFFQLDGPSLRLVASVYGTQRGEMATAGDFAPLAASGYGSHVMGSRNLDMALAGDLDGDGQLEVLVPNQTRTHLTAIRRSKNGANAIWAVPIGGHLSSNLAAVNLPGVGIIVGAGHDEGKLRLWLPQ
jgi:hypothetical protein